MAVAAANIIFGHGGTYVIAIMIMISTFGCINGLVLAGARVYYTMAGDGLFFKKAGTLNNNAVPGWSLWAQCLVAAILCLSGKYSDLLDMISLVAVGFYALTMIGIFILRKRRPDLERPYKAFGYPVLPAIYILLAHRVLCGPDHTKARLCDRRGFDRVVGNSLVLYSFVPQKSIKQCPISLNYSPVLARSGPG